MIVANSYIVRRGDTLQRIARAYLGQNAGERWRDLVVSNPQWNLRLIRTPYGFEPVPQALPVGSTIFLPMVWPRVPVMPLGPIELPGGRDFPRGAVGAVPFGPENPSPRAGQKCEAGAAITNVKPYVYVVDGDGTPYPGALAQQWAGSQARWGELKRANYDMPEGFIYDIYDTCNFAKWVGAKLKIPASWPEVPASLASKIEQVGGTAPPPGTPPPQTQPPPQGQPPGGTPVGATPPGGTLVGAKEEDKGMPTWVWIVGGVVVGGAAIYLGTRLMAKKAPAQGPTRTPDRRDAGARVAAARLQPPAPVNP